MSLADQRRTESLGRRAPAGPPKAEAGRWRRPAACAAHRRDHLGYAGRRVLVSRKWSGKTLADHRGDRKAWLTEMLGLPATDPTSYRWEQVQPADEDYLPPARRLMHAVADRLHWEHALAEARRRARDALADELSATARAA